MANDSEDKMTAAVSLASNLLTLQLQGAEMNLKSLSDFDDHFALGYIFGFHDCVCQLSGIKRNDTEGFTMFALSYAELAGEDGIRIARQSMDLSQGDKVFLKGAQAGGSDFVAFARSKTDPLGLFRYLRKEYGGV